MNTERTLFPADEPRDAAPSLPRTERLLLILAGLFLAANGAALTVLRPALGWRIWLHFGIWAACAAAGHWWLQRRLPMRDQLLFPIGMLLSGWGLLVIGRLLPQFADRQALWLAMGTAALALASGFPHALRWLRSYRYVILVLGLALLIATILLGRNPSGQEGAPALWLELGVLFVQPSEIMKILLVAFLATYLAEQFPVLSAEIRSGGRAWRAFSPRIVGPILLMWGLSLVILVWQRDLGTAGLFFIVFLLLLYVSSGSLAILASGALLGITAVFAAYHLFSVVQLRVDIWLNPWPESAGRAYQIVQSLMAFGAGGVFGQGIGQGLPGYVPVVHSDFVFAAIGEEWGLLGVVVVIAGIAALFVRGLRSALRYPAHSFRALLTVGLSLLLAVQSLMIMGGVLKLIPLTGVTLPFLSYGGSSLVMSFVTLGLLLRLSTGED